MRTPPEAETNGLAPDEAFVLSSYFQFGLPYTSGMMGLVDRRGDLYMPRQAWLDRSLPEGWSREAFEMFFADLDDYHLTNETQRMEAEAAKVKAKGKGGKRG